MAARIARSPRPLMACRKWFRHSAFMVDGPAECRSLTLGMASERMARLLSVFAFDDAEELQQRREHVVEGDEQGQRSIDVVGFAAVDDRAGLVEHHA